MHQWLRYDRHLAKHEVVRILDVGLTNEASELPPKWRSLWPRRLEVAGFVKNIIGLCFLFITEAFTSTDLLLHPSGGKNDRKF